MAEAKPLSPALARLIGVIDAFTEFSGRLVAWILVPMALAVGYEVFARYLFNAPTKWVFDITYMSYGTLFMLGAHYTLKRGAHIRTDMLWATFSDRKKGMIDTLAYLFFFFPGMFMLFFVGWGEAYHAFTVNETSEQTAWRPLLWPFKFVVPITAILLMVQGVSETIKSIYAWRTGQPYETKEGAEV
ncbi:MAG: TRAP transporter small permease subunit [Burkholderiales bacterium]|nr:TRAP transporter small permease subunit [Burkholderiales bacterium]